MAQAACGGERAMWKITAGIHGTEEMAEKEYTYHARTPFMVLLKTIYVWFFFDFFEITEEE